MSILDKAMATPDVCLGHKHCQTDEDHDIVDEGGGALWFCSTCEFIAQPNRPCFCGMALVQNAEGLFFSHEENWVSDWRWKADHMWPKQAKLVAETLGAKALVIGEDKF